MQVVNKCRHSQGGFLPEGFFWIGMLGQPGLGLVRVEALQIRILQDDRLINGPEPNAVRPQGMRGIPLLDQPVLATAVEQTKSSWLTDVRRKFQQPTLLHQLSYASRSFSVLGIKEAGVADAGLVASLAVAEGILKVEAANLAKGQGDPLMLH